MTITGSLTLPGIECGRDYPSISLPQEKNLQAVASSGHEHGPNAVPIVIFVIGK